MSEVYLETEDKDLDGLRQEPPPAQRGEERKTRYVAPLAASKTWAKAIPLGELF